MTPQSRSTGEALTNGLMHCAAFALASVLLLSATVSSAHAEPSAAKRVLLISTGGRFAPGFQIVDRQLVRAFQEVPLAGIDLYTENLDVIRFPAERSQRIFADYLAEKYATQPPDLVILVYVGNLGILGEVMVELFPGAPIIVAGFTEEEIQTDQLGSSVIGFAQRADPRATLELMLRLQPELQRIVVISGTSEVDRQLLRRIEQAAEQLKGQIDIEIWDNFRLGDLREAVAALPPATAILFGRMFRDAAGRAFASGQVGQLIGQLANAPVYVISDANLGTGVLGGYVASIEAFGKRAGELAVRILTGTPPAAVPFEIRTETVPMFDWRALQRWGIQESRLPPGSVIRYRPPSMWDQYRWYIVGALALVLAQGGLIVVLILQRRQRRQIEVALRESQQWMELATEAAGLGLWARDLTRSTLWANASMRSLYGLEREGPLRFDDVLARVHPDDRAQVIAEVARTQAAAASYEGEFRICRPDGAERWVLVKGSPIVDPQRGNARRVGVVLDVTDRKKGELALRESEERFRTLADKAPVMIWMSGPDKLTTFFNTGWLEFTGRRLEQELGNGWTESVHTDDVERCLDMYLSAVDARQEFRIEYRLRRHDGQYRDIVDHGVPRFAPDGTYLGYVGTCIDVTERKQVAEWLEKQRSFLRQIININPNLIFAKDREGRFTLANQAVADVYGTTVDELIGRTDADFNPNIEEVEFFRTMDTEVMNTLRERFIPEERITDARGNVHWLQTVKRPIIGADGRSDLILGTSTDITLRKKAEIELQEQRASLAHVGRVTMMGELAASLVHELNQPLTAIQSNAQAGVRLMSREPLDMKELREILRDIIQANIRAVEIIYGMRAMVKKGAELNFTRVDLANLACEVVALVHSDALIHDVHIALELDDELPPVGGDRVQLQQVLLNLLLNAFDAMKESSASDREIILRVKRQDNRMNCVSVSDRGPGIAPTDLEKIFQPFYTTKREGLGMGLSICRSIVEAHGGSLWAENAPDHGTTFYFTVPLAERELIAKG